MVGGMKVVGCVVVAGGEIRSLTVDISRLMIVDEFIPNGLN